MLECDVIVLTDYKGNVGGRRSPSIKGCGGRRPSPIKGPGG